MLDCLEFFDPLTEEAPHRLPQRAVIHSAERLDYPRAALPKRPYVRRCKRPEEGVSKLTGAIADAACINLPLDEPPMHHQVQAALHNAPADQKLRRAVWELRMQALRSPDVAAMHYQI